MHLGGAESNGGHSCVGAVPTIDSQVSQFLYFILKILLETLVLKFCARPVRKRNKYPLTKANIRISIRGLLRKTKYENSEDTIHKR